MKDHLANHQELKATMRELRRRNPLLMGAFDELHRRSTSPGALPTKTKELIALAIAISVRCDGCIAFHIHDALKAGATRQEIVETIGVTVLMGGGPSLTYGCEALRALDQFHQRQVAGGPEGPIAVGGRAADD